MKKFALIIFVLSYVSVAAQPYPELSISHFLTDDDQKNIGLQKLSENQKEQLRILIIEIYLEGFEDGKEEGIDQAIKYFDQEQNNLTTDAIESQIDGEYEGWDGETIVKLINGQIWQQQEYYYTYHYAFMPEVIIYKDGSGYKMKVEGVEKSVGVIRIR